MLRGMVWADSYWLFCDNKEKLVCMVNDITGERLDLDMEPKPESLWWTSTYKDEGAATLKRGKIWDLPSSELFDVLGCRFHRDAKGFQCTERTLCKGYGQLVAGQVRLSLKGCTHAGKMPKSL